MATRKEYLDLAEEALNSGDEATAMEAMAEAEKMSAAPAAAVATPKVTKNPEQLKQEQEAEFQALQKQNMEDMGFGERFVAGYGSAMPAIGSAVKQLYAGATGNEEMSQRLMAEEAERRRRDKALEDTWGGKLGNIAGNVAAGIPVAMGAAAAAPAGLAGAIGAGAAEGATMGALAPTAEEGERTSNVLWGGGLGGALPAVGAGVRKMTGTVDPEMLKAADILRGHGVNIPKGDISPGMVSETANYMLNNTPGVNLITKNMAGAKEDTVRKALFNMLDSNVPTNNSDMLAIKQGLGDQFVDFSKGKQLDVTGITSGVDDTMKKYARIMKSQMSPAVLKQAGELKDIATNISNLPNGKLKGEAYQAIRGQLATDAAATGGEHAVALKGLISTLDDALERSVSPSEFAEKQALNQKYRIASALSKSADIREELPIPRIRKILEDANKRGAVKPEALDLIRAADKAIPKIKPKGMETTKLGGLELLAALSAPFKVAGAIGVGVGSKALMNTGVPQRAANSPMTRKIVSQFLKGTMQSELSDED